MNINVTSKSEQVSIPVKVIGEGGYSVIGGHEIITAKIRNSMTPYQREQYDFMSRVFNSKRSYIR